MKDLKEIIKLSEHINEDDLETSIEEENTEKKDDENIWKKRMNARKPMVSPKESSTIKSKQRKRNLIVKNVIFKELNKWS